jgi:enoyl-CoA hydratase
MRPLAGGSTLLAMPSPLQATFEDGLALLQMDDGKANALSSSMIDDLISALDRAEKEAAAVVLIGRPDRFCAGFDLKVMMSGPAAATALLRTGSNLLMRLYESPLPIVSACTGHALAGGALVLCATDLRLGVEGPYRIGLNEVSIGMPVPILAMELARDRLAGPALTHATLFAEVYDPAGAVAVGYLDRLVPREELLAAAKTEAKRLGAFPRHAYAATKTRLRGRTIEHIRSTLEKDLESLLPPS